MSTAAIIGWIAGVGGLGLAGAFAFLAATGALPALLGAFAVVRFFPSIGSIGRFLVSPPGLMVLGALALIGAWIAGDLRGKRVTAAAYEKRISESIEANKAFDRKLAEETEAKAREQEQAADERVKAAEQRVVDYEQRIKSCEVGGAADWLNDDGGVPAPGRSIPRPPQPPRRP